MGNWEATRHFKLGRQMTLRGATPAFALCMQVNRDRRMITIKQPVGVMACIIPHFPCLHTLYTGQP